MLKRNSY